MKLLSMFGTVQNNKRQRGDTIIEVLIAMSVVGLVLASSFAITNRATLTGRAAQERTEALKLAESQLELLKVYGKDVAFNNSSFSSFCIDQSAASAATAAVDSNDTAKCKGVNGQGAVGIYSITITQMSGTYEVKITWQEINSGSSVDATLVLYYRLGAL